MLIRLTNAKLLQLNPELSNLLPTNLLPHQLPLQPPKLLNRHKLLNLHKATNLAAI